MIFHYYLTISGTIQDSDIGSHVMLCPTVMLQVTLTSRLFQLPCIF